MRTFTARWIFPVCGPPLERGTLTIDGGRIVAVEPRGGTFDEDFGDACIIPGLVNAHTHLDLTGAAGMTVPVPGEGFPDWLMRVIAYRRTRSEHEIAADIQRGIAECRRFGVTLVGDIAAGGKSFQFLSRAALRSVVFWELIGTTLERFESSLHTAILGMAAQPNTANGRWGRSPHAPYTVNRRGYELVSQLPGIAAVHLAESSEEMELLEHRTGSFVPFLQKLNVWEPDGLIRDPREFLSTHPEQRLLVVHGNTLPADTQLSANQSLVICPRTHAAFGHPPHPFREFLNRGVNVAVGTDSLASNPDLDLFAELVELHHRYPDVPGSTLLEMGTRNGAIALGFADECGTLAPDSSADFVVLPCGVGRLPCGAGREPYECLWNSTAERRIFFRGQ